MEKENEKKNVFQTLINSTPFLKVDTVKKKCARNGKKQVHIASHGYFSNYIFEVKTLF